MTKKHSNWESYWKDIQPRLNHFVTNERLADVEKYLSSSLGFFSFVTEDLETKVTKNQDLITVTFPLIVELQDILRGVFLSQSNLLVSTSAFQLRAAFEIRCNLKYIFLHADPKMVATRLSNYFRYEQIVGSRLSPNLKYEGIAVERSFALEHPYWAKPDGLLKDNTTWNGEGMDLKKICDEIGLSAEFFTNFKITSKFIHGSPIVKNLYTSEKGIHCIASSRNVAFFTLMCALHIGRCLKEYCNFFGIEFSEIEYLEIELMLLAAQKSLGLVPR